MSQYPLKGGLLLSLWLSAVGAQAAASPCEEAWAVYNEFKVRNVMEASQYPLTVQGAAVRAACGADALPVPPGSDVAPLPRVRKHRPPVNPPPTPGAPRP